MYTGLKPGKWKKQQSNQKDPKVDTVTLQEVRWKERRMEDIVHSRRQKTKLEGRNL